MLPNEQGMKKLVSFNYHAGTFLFFMKVRDPGGAGRTDVSGIVMTRYRFYILINKNTFRLAVAAGDGPELRSLSRLDNVSAEGRKTYEIN